MRNTNPDPGRFNMVTNLKIKDTSVYETKLTKLNFIQVKKNRIRIENQEIQIKILQNQPSIASKRTISL